MLVTFDLTPYYVYDYKTYEIRNCNKTDPQLCKNRYLLSLSTTSRRPQKYTSIISLHVIFTGKSELKVQKVAFFVGLQDNINQFDEDVDAKDIIFEKVVTNVGEAYTSDTGRFTAPLNGTYSFTVVVAAQGKHKVRMHSTPD